MSVSDSVSRTAESSDVRWLDPAEQDAWRAYLASTRLIFDLLERQLQADAGMPLAYYDILVTLSEAPAQTMQMGTLARSLRNSASRLSHAVTKLESCGWVRRESHPSDRRAQLAVLTNDGATALADAAPGHVAAVRRSLFDALTPTQVKQLHAISRALLDAAGPEI